MKKVESASALTPLHKLERQVFRFNVTHRVGSMVDIKLDSGEIKTVTVASEATILHGHSAVGWFKELSGCYLLNRVCSPASNAKP